MILYWKCQKTSSQVFRGQPLPICSSTTYTSLPKCPFFQHVQTNIVYPFVCSFSCLPTPGDTFYPLVPRYTSAVSSSCQVCEVFFFHCSGLTSTTSPDTCLESLDQRENTLEVSRGKSSLIFFHPYLNLFTMLSALIVTHK